MTYEDYSSGDGGSTGSNGVSAPQAILDATRPKPRKPMSAGSAAQSVLPEATQSDASKGTPADAGVAPSSQDTSSAGVGAPSVQAVELTGSPLDPSTLTPSSPVLPTLAQQGSSNPLLRALQRVTGWIGPQPEPGKLYAGPTTEQGKVGALGNFLQRVGDAGTMTAGSNAQKEFLLQGKRLDLERQQLQNEAAWRAANLKELQGWHRTQGDIRQQQADAASQNADTKAQKLQNDQYQFSQGLIPIDATAARVLFNNPAMAGQSVPSKVYEAILRQRNFEHVETPEGTFYVNKTNPQEKYKLSDGSVRLEAARISGQAAQNRYLMRPVSVIDPRDNTVRYMTGADAIQLNAMPASQGAKVMSQQAQFSDIENASQMLHGIIAQMTPLNAVDIAALTKAANSKDEAAAHNIVQNYAQGVLDPLQKQFLIWQGQIIERAMSLRNIAGMGQASDSLRQRIIATLPNAGDTADVMEGKLQAFDNMVGNLKAGVPNLPKTPIHTAAQGGGQGSGKGSPVTLSEAQDYLRRAGGDKAKARALAKADGRTF